MTIVCCWFDRSSGRSRITAIADARTSIQVNGRWQMLSDTTVKLFRVRVKCHTLEAFNMETATLQDPYYETEIGIGFSGYCLEAMTIIALFAKAMEQMATVGDTTPLPDPKRIVSALESIITRYFNGHTNRAAQRVEFLVFGFSPEKQPWLATVKYNPERGLIFEFDNPMQVDRSYAIGDAGNQQFRQRLNDLLKRIAKHATGLKPGLGADATFEHQLAQAEHLNAQKKIAEDLTLDKVNDEIATTVGGVLQKIELYQTGDRAVVSFSRESQGDILDGLTVADGLVYLPVGELMGRNVDKGG